MRYLAFVIEFAATRLPWRREPWSSHVHGPVIIILFFSFHTDVYNFTSRTFLVQACVLTEQYIIYGYLGTQPLVPGRSQLPSPGTFLNL